MNVRRFTARTSRDALAMVRLALGDDAVVLSTQPSAGGVDVLAMAPEGMRQIERMAAQPAAPVAAGATLTPGTNDVADDVTQLSMSTLSFQDYVRERMLRRRQASATPAVPAAPAATMPAVAAPPGREPVPSPERPTDPVDRFAPRPAAALSASPRHDSSEMLDELRAMKGLIEERFGALAFIDRLNRQPAQARLTQKLLGCGFSPALIRKIGDGLPADVTDEAEWLAGVLERNLQTAEAEAALEDQGGVFALVGATGVGKTTTTAKIAAAFAAKHGAAHLGLITLDAYRIGAHEQLRAYGRILGVPVHTAHDRASLEDLLDLLAAKKMVLIDTAGMAQRDARTRELLEMVSHRSIRKLLVVNAASQGETIEDVMISYHASVCAGVVLSKLDEAVKLGPALDALIRMKLKVVGVANGQRVPEDWHRLSASALVQRALRSGGSSAYRLDASDVSLIFAAPRGAAAACAGNVAAPRHA